MTFRMRSLQRHAFLRLSNAVCHRCYAAKPVQDVPDENISLSKLYNSRRTHLLLNYINDLYKGEDKRLKSLQPAMYKVYKMKNECGPLQSLDDIVKSAGLTPKEAVQLCEEISKVSIKKRSKMHLSYPTFTVEDSKKVNSLLAIHSSLYCVAWTHLERSGRVLSWHKENLPLGEKDMHAIDCVRAVSSFCDKIPVADAYIMETPNVRRAQKSSEALNAFLQSNINCSILSFISCPYLKKQTFPRIYYMNRALVPLLYDLTVGTETVSRIHIVEGIINKTISNDTKDYIEIILDDWLRDLFAESNNKVREELSTPLLAAVTAMEILVRRNQHALEKIMGG